MSSSKMSPEYPITSPLLFLGKSFSQFPFLSKFPLQYLCIRQIYIKSTFSHSSSKNRKAYLGLAGNLCLNYGRQQYGWRSLIVQSEVFFKPDKLHPRVVLKRAHCDRTTPEPTGHVRQQVVLRKTNCLKVSEGFLISEKS